MKSGAYPLLLLLFSLASSQAQSASPDLRDEIEAQRALILEQKALLESQQRQLEDLSRRLEEMERATVPGAPDRGAPQATPELPPTKRVADGKPPAEDSDRTVRDAVGDLNQDGVRAGEFLGSILIPGTGNVSLAVGGMVKSAVIFDLDAEAQGADFLPATLGTSRPDTGGAASLDSTLTRLNVDGRAPLPSGNLRGYVEWDLNRGNNGSPDFKLRHAYGTWETEHGTLVAGHTWSTLMDLKILPEGLTEPTVSGVMFSRQAQLRWSQPLNRAFTVHGAIENPDSNDVFSETPSLNFTSVPDFALGIEYDVGSGWHTRLNGIVRKLDVDLPNGMSDQKTGWGMALTGHVDLFEQDRLVFSGVYGEGLGRYLLGIQPTSGAAITADGDALKLRDNWGGMVSYRHQWAEGIRSHAMVGHAKSDALASQPGSTFENSTYAAINLLWTLQSYLTLGVEYGYGRRENKDNSSLDNHRVMFGVQIF